MLASRGAKGGAVDAISLDEAADLQRAEWSAQRSADHSYVESESRVMITAIVVKGYIIRHPCDSHGAARDPQVL